MTAHFTYLDQLNCTLKVVVTQTGVAYLYIYLPWHANNDAYQGYLRIDMALDYFRLQRVSYDKK